MICVSDNQKNTIPPERIYLFIYLFMELFQKNFGKRNIRIEPERPSSYPTDIIKSAMNLGS